jgi:UDP-N-acetylmuramate dehydrogenase
LNKLLVAKSLQDISGPGSIKIDEPMSNHTSFKVGGPADILVTPDNKEELQKIVKLCRSEKIPLFILGNGTNLIVRDKGIRGIVVKIAGKFSKINVADEIIEAQAGILLSKLANAAMESHLTGLEFASGIPGTLGGAVTMNAGAYEGEMKDVIHKTLYMDNRGEFAEIQGDEHQFAYRSSFIQKSGGIVLSSLIKLKRGKKEEIKGLMDDLNQRRKDKQPLELPSAGSVFKRPEGHYTGKLIENCGLKGFQMGGAQVSGKHCGFIVNSGNATCDDIVNLIKYVQISVKDKFGVELQTEVKIVGEE